MPTFSPQVLAPVVPLVLVPDEHVEQLAALEKGRGTGAKVSAGQGITVSVALS